jgi:hypothetical protein
MKTYTIGSNKVYTTWDEVGYLAIDLPKISYPFDFTSEVFSIEQTYLAKSNALPVFRHGTSHPQYPASISVSQSSASLNSTGLLTFTIKYLQIPKKKITLPSTSSYTFPSISLGINYEKRSIKIIDQSITNEQGEKVTVPVPAPSPVYFRRYPVTKTIPVFEEWEFVDLQTYSLYINVDISQVSPGDILSHGTVTNIEFTDGKYGVTFLDGLVISFFAGTQVSVRSTATDPSKIQIDEAFKIYDKYRENINQNAQVSFIDAMTEPSTNKYLELVEKNPSQLLFTSQIEHYEGMIYLKKNIYGDLV